MRVHDLLIHELGSWLRRTRSHPFISTLANLTQHIRGIHTDSEKTDSMVKNKHLPETNSVCKIITVSLMCYKHATHINAIK